MFASLHKNALIHSQRTDALNKFAELAGTFSATLLQCFQMFSSYRYLEAFYLQKDVCSSVNKLTYWYSIGGHRNTTSI